jgi:hypothetical protein
LVPSKARQKVSAVAKSNGSVPRRLPIMSKRKLEPSSDWLRRVTMSQSDRATTTHRHHDDDDDHEEEEEEGRQQSVMDA